MADGKEVEIRSKFDATGIESGVAQAKASVQSLGPAAKQAGAEASKALDGAFTQSIKRVGEATAEASKETMTWVQFVKANMGPAMRQFSAEGVAHSEAHTKAIRQIAEQWKIYKATGIDANRSVAQSVAESAAGLNASQSRSLEGIKRQVIGLTEGRAALLSYRAAQAGIAAEAAPFIAKAAAVEKGLTGIGMSARETAYAIRGVPAQLTDIFTSLASGQRPLQVFLQQGGQLKDMFGGAGPAARALGGYIVGLVNPFTIAAAAAVGLFLAFKQGSAESEAYNKALILTGNAAGTTADKLAEMAKRIGSANGTVSGAAAALAEMAGSTRIGAANLERFTSTAVRMEQLIGQPVAETRKQFEELAKAPAEASIKLNETYNFLTASVYKQIKALEEQGRATDAARVAQEAFDTAMRGRMEALAQNLGIVERAWKGIVGTAKEAWDAMLGVGRTATLGDQLKDIDKSIAAAQGVKSRTADTGLLGIGIGSVQDARIASLQAQRDIIAENLRLESRAATAAGERTAAERARVDWLAKANDYLSKEERLQQKIKEIRNEGKAAGASPAEIDARIAAERQKILGSEIKKANKELEDQENLIASLSGLSKSFYKDWDALTKAFQRGRLSLEQLQAAQAALLADQPAMKDAKKAEAEETKKLEQSEKELLKVRAESITAQTKAAKETDDLIKKLRDEAEAFGMTAEAIARRTLQRGLETDAQNMSALAIKAGMAVDEAELLVINKQIDALRELSAQRIATAGAASNNRAVEANKSLWETMTRDSERFSDQIGQALANSIMDGGKSGVEYLKGLLRTSFLQPMFRPVSNAISGAVSGIMGNPGAAGSAVGGFGSLMSLGGSFNAGFQGMFNSAATSGIGQSLGLSSVIENAFGETGVAISAFGAQVGQTLPYLASIAALANGKYATAALSAIGTAIAGPIGAVIGSALGSLFDKTGGGPKSGGSAVATIAGSVMTQAERDARLYTPGGSDAQLLATTFTLAQSVQAMALRFGGNASSVRFGLGFDTDPLGTAPNRISAFAGDFSVTNRDLGRDQGSIERGIAEELIRLTLAGLQASNLTDGFAELFNRLDPATASPDAINNLIALAESLRALGEQAKYLPGAMGQVASLSATAREALVNLAGGFDALIANQASFAQNFLSPVERVRIDEQSIGAEFKRITGAELSTLTSGKTAEEIRTTFKQLVLGIDLTTEHGPAAYAALLALNAPMAKFITDLESVGGTLPAVESAADRIKRLTGEIESMDSALAEILGTVEQSPLDKLRATVSLRDSIQGARAGIAETIQETTISGFKARGDTAGAVAFLKGIEEQLWSKLGTALDDGSTAQKIVEAFSRRMGLEAELTAADVSVESLRTQISLLEAMQRSAESIRDTLLDLTTGSLSALSPQAQLAASRSDFESTLSRARGGDAQAVANLAGSGRGFLAEAQSFFGSGGDFANIFKFVTGALSEFGAFDPAELIAKQEQLKAAEGAATDNSGAVISGLTEIDTKFSGAVDTLNTDISSQAGVLREQLKIMQAERDAAIVERDKNQIRWEAMSTQVTQLKTSVDALSKDLALA